MSETVKIQIVPTPSILKLNLPVVGKTEIAEDGTFEAPADKVEELLSCEMQDRKFVVFGAKEEKPAETGADEGGEADEEISFKVLEKKKAGEVKDLAGELVEKGLIDQEALDACNNKLEVIDLILKACGIETEEDSKED